VRSGLEVCDNVANRHSTSTPNASSIAPSPRLSVGIFPAALPSQVISDTNRAHMTKRQSNASALALSLKNGCKTHDRIDTRALQDKADRRQCHQQQERMITLSNALHQSRSG